MRNSSELRKRSAVTKNYSFRKRHKGSKPCRNRSLSSNVNVINFSSKRQN